MAKWITYTDWTNRPRELRGDQYIYALMAFRLCQHSNLSELMILNKRFSIANVKGHWLMFEEAINGKHVKSRKILIVGEKNEQPLLVSDNMWTKHEIE